MTETTAPAKPMLPAPYSAVSTKKVHFPSGPTTYVEVNGETFASVSHQHFVVQRDIALAVDYLVATARKQVNEGASVQGPDPSNAHLHLLWDTMLAVDPSAKITAITVDPHTTSQKYRVEAKMGISTITAYLNDKGYFYKAHVSGKRSSVYQASSNRGYKSHTTRQVFQLLLDNITKGDL